MLCAQKMTINRNNRDVGVSLYMLIRSIQVVLSVHVND